MMNNLPYATRCASICSSLKKITFLVLLIIFATCSGLYAQTIVTGVVTDTQQSPLPGVNVKIENGTGGTVTDANGKFGITVKNKNAVLLFTYVGFTPLRVPLEGKQQISVTLKEKTIGLDEIVVTGYGAQKKKDITGAVGVAPIEDINKAPAFSLGESLEGRVAGIQISTADGQPGAGINITVRGPNSITQDNNPLFVIDGFPIEGFDISMLSPQDIESIDFLKDASATAIYGARGANGVMIITTKKGKEGIPVLNFSTTQSYMKPIKLINLMDSYDFLKMQLERDPTAGSATNKTATYMYFTVPNKTLADYVNAPTADYQIPFFQTGAYRNYYLALRGGNAQTKYSISGSVDDQTGTVINTSSKRYEGRFSLDQNVSDKLKAGVNAGYSVLAPHGNVLSANNGFASALNQLYSVWGANPLSPISATTPLDAYVNPATDYRFNPILNQSNVVNNVTTANLNVNAYLSYNITRSLTFRVTGIINNAEINTERFYNSNTYSGSVLTAFGATSGANGSVSTSKSNNWTNENTLTWNKSFGKHSLNVLAGFTNQGNTSNAYGFGAKFLPNEALGVSGLDEGTLDPGRTIATSSSWTMQSWLGRVNYDYNKVYYLTASFRADGSSKFAPRNHWGYFPSASAAWRFTQVGFLKDNRVLSDGKLRFGYGVTGNNRVSDFAYAAQTGLPIQSAYSFMNNTALSLIPLTVANPDLKWETTAQYNAGLDLSFFGDRIAVTTDLYRKTTTNLLLNATLPTSSGYSTAYENIGSVQNQGLEITINTININSGKFKWTSNFNIAFNANKVLALVGNQESLTFNGASGWGSVPSYIAKVGQPLGQMFGFIWLGNYQYSDFYKTATGGYILKDNVPGNGNTRTSIQPGDIKYQDLNGDGVVNAQDYAVIGHSLPIHTGGFSNNFTYKNFDLNIFFNWSYGNNIQDASRALFESGQGSFVNQFASYEDRWSPTNQNSPNNRVNGYYGSALSSKTVEDGSYLRLKTVQLGYNLPSSLLKKLKISLVKVFVSGQNLWIWTHYTGEDPEVSTLSPVLQGGFDYSAYPRSRTIAFGANINF